MLNTTRVQAWRLRPYPAAATAGDEKGKNMTKTKTNACAATAKEILDLKAGFGPASFLWVQPDAGDVILWADVAQSINDDGARAAGRWTVDTEVMDALLASGEVDDQN